MRLTPPDPNRLNPAIVSQSYGATRARLDHENTGRCGASPPVVFHQQPPWSDADCCALPAGHAGWHRNDDDSEWGTRTPAEDTSDHLLTHGLLADGGQCPHCGYVKPGPYRLTVEQEIRARALDAVARLDWYPDDPDATPADATLRLAAKFAAWIDIGANPPDAEIVDEDDPLDLESGPDVACSCNPAADPDPTEHVHAAPWGCTVCPCRHYPDPNPSTVEVSGAGRQRCRLDHGAPAVESALYDSLRAALLALAEKYAVLPAFDKVDQHADDFVQDLRALAVKDEVRVGHPDRSMPLSEALAAVQDAYREHETTVEAPDA